MRDARRRESGYLMAGMVAAVAILVIFSTLAFQEWAQVLRRDNEAEMIFRAQDLVRAIQRYRRDHGGAAPGKLEDLMQPGTRNQYVLRQLWKDPLVRDGKWGVIYVGPNGELIDPNAAASPEGQGAMPGVGPGTGTPGAFGTTNPTFGQPGAAGQGAFGGQQKAPAGKAPAVPGVGGAGNDPNVGGKQLAGLPIAGVRSLCTDEPFRVYNGLSDYSQWLFTYFDLERQQVPGQKSVGAPPQQPQGNPFPQPSLPGNQPGSNRGFPKTKKP